MASWQADAMNAPEKSKDVPSVGWLCSMATFEASSLPNSPTTVIVDPEEEAVKCFPFREKSIAVIFE